MATLSADPHRVRLLEHDLELAEAAPPDELELATANVLAATFDLEDGPWLDAEHGFDGCFGLMVLDGLLTRSVECAGVRSLELLGAGDVIRPWDTLDPLAVPEVRSSWAAHDPVHLALLDRRILQFGAKWPELIDELVRRMIDRSRWLTVRLAIGSANRIDERLLLFFWHAASRWGKVTLEGTAIPLNLTHSLLADLVGAARPSVTSALGDLAERGELSRVPDGWMLTGEPPATPSRVRAPRS